MDAAAARRYDDDLRLAHVIADQVDAHTMNRFGSRDLEIGIKTDDTYVTDADKHAEEIVRSQLSRARPRDAVLGEEMGKIGSAARQWIVDPIDGTANFLRGVPVWASLLALVEDGEPVLGLVSAPALGRRWWAATGKGSHTGRSFGSARKLQVSGVDTLKDAFVSYSSLGGWAERGQLRAFLQLLEKTWRSRAFGDFWSYMLVAEGSVDIACEPELSLWDMAALVPIVTEAGGRFTSLTGQPGPFGGNALATNGLLQEAVLETLGSLSD